MRLEKEIKQSSFRNEYHKLAVNLIFSHSWLMAKINNLLKKFDITPQQFNILRILRGQYPSSSTVTLLRERMLDKMSDASRLVDRLCKKKLVERRVCENDRRKVDVYITKKGLNLLKDLDKYIIRIDDVLMKNLSEDEAKKLNKLLDKMRT